MEKLIILNALNYLSSFLLQVQSNVSFNVTYTYRDANYVSPVSQSYTLKKSNYKGTKYFNVFNQPEERVYKYSRSYNDVIDDWKVSIDIVSFDYKGDTHFYQDFNAKRPPQEYEEWKFKKCSEEALFMAEWDLNR